MKTGCIARLQSRVWLSPNTSSSKLTQIQTGCSNSWSVELVKYDDLKETTERHWEYAYSQYTCQSKSVVYRATVKETVNVKENTYTGMIGRYLEERIFEH